MKIQAAGDNEGSVLVPILIFIAVFIFIIIMSRRNQSTISRRGIFYPGGFPLLVAEAIGVAVEVPIVEEVSVVLAEAILVAVVPEVIGKFYARFYE